MPAHLDITLAENNASGSLDDRLLLDVFHVLLKYAGMKGRMTQIPLQDARKTLHMSVAAFMDSLLQLEYHDVLTLNGTFYSELTNRRYGETKYAVQKNTYRYFCLHILFEALRDILNDCRINQDYNIDAEQREFYTKHIEEACGYDPDELKHETKKHGDRDVKIDYMPWKDEYSLPNYAVTKCETFIKDMIRLGVRRMFIILAHTPGIKFKDDRRGSTLSDR